MDSVFVEHTLLALNELHDDEVRDELLVGDMLLLVVLLVLLD